MNPHGRGGRGWRPGGRGGHAGGYLSGHRRGSEDFGRGADRSRPSAHHARGLCHGFQQTGRCRFGNDCNYSHNLSSPAPNHACGTRPTERPEETPEQQLAKAAYNSWKRLIKVPPRSNDIDTIRSIWSGALEILNGNNRDWQQQLPRDLDDDDFFGRQHMATLLSMKAPSHGYSTFIDLARSFVSVITHPALLDCLSVDTSVGGLYNFISGANGSRAIPFFQHLREILLAQYLQNDSHDILATDLNGMLIALRELLKRERRIAFHDDVVDLVVSIENTIDASGLDKQSNIVQVVIIRIRGLRATIDRARRLVEQEERPATHGVSTTVVFSTYPREITLPGGRHDNDEMDITKIRILPTANEIRSNQPEFLPSTDFQQPHFLADNAERHLDTMFRLLRHDIFGEIKQALGQMMDDIEKDPSMVENLRLSLGIRAYVSPRAQITYLSFSRDQKRGLEAQISFPQPQEPRKKSLVERCKWWQESKRLEEGTLLCFVFTINLTNSILFFTVNQKCTDSKEKFSLTSHNHQATIVTKLATQNQSDLELLTQLHAQGIRGVLIELPGVLLATFTPILENIQNMARSSRMPFSQWILPDLNATTSDPLTTLDIPPPLYARAPGFSYSLRSILNDAGDDIRIAPSRMLSGGRQIDELKRRTDLDHGQCEALLAALTREYAFIQGPPGTGKSFLGVRLMRILLDCKKGPIIVVCYTNHALDQFLEHLVQIGIQKVVRIGGQSKSEILEGKNLRIVSQSELKTRSESYLLGSTFGALEKEEQSIRSSLAALQTAAKRPSWVTLKKYLQYTHNRIYAQFSQVDKEGFKTVGAEPFDLWLRGNASQGQAVTGPPTRTAPQLLVAARLDAHSLSPVERRALVQFWTDELRTERTDELFESVETVNKLRRTITNVHDDIDRRVLQTADVIGVTTTGLARRIATLQHVECKIIICEEAGEVMEPHMISALLPSVEHFIQIGDHQQLRPQINNFKQLSLESHQGKPYQLDRSQFERLSERVAGKPSFPIAQLNIQRRMRPDISMLIRETIYSGLTDHETTTTLPDVVGMRKNVFWLNHSNQEEGRQADTQQKSHSNAWEVAMTHALVRHIIRQGIYSSTDIAVLTPYGGQLQKLRTAMRNDFEIVLSDRDQETLAKEGFDVEDSSSEDGGIRASSERPGTSLQKKRLNELLRLATVDNFQGEEAKIVIVSLVRSNDSHKVGFLKTTNRINVLLSRAQHGMYLVGNVETYSQVPMWAQVLAMLRSKNSTGEALELCCPRHTDTEILVTEPGDFARLSPEGGCRLACDKRLPACGHRCEARCHSDGMHEVFACPQPCQRQHSACNHSCQGKTCGEDCGVCMVKLDGIQLPCGHSKDRVHCHMAQTLDKIKCTVVVLKEMGNCQHMVMVECWKDIASASFHCPTSCGTVLTCGHLCSGTCGRCNTYDADGKHAIKHTDCKRVCGRPFGVCNHVCKRPCHVGTACSLCTAPCEVRCAHSRCPSTCSEPCAPCVEKCTWSCEHQGSCSLPCAAPCNRLPCDQRCVRILHCGHQCPSLCGETCPEQYCQECSDRQDQRVDLLEMKSYKEIDLTESPIVVLGCGHFFTAETLDGLMGMAEVYIEDGHGKLVGLKDLSCALAGPVPRCPDCQCVVRQFATQRFNRVINRAVIDEMSKRFLVNGQMNLRELEQKVSSMEQSLEATKQAIVNSISPANPPTQGHLTRVMQPDVTSTLRARYNRCREVEKAVDGFLNNVADKHQPAHKLHAATVHAARTQPLEHSMATLTVEDSIPAVERDRRVILGGRAAKLKTEYITLVDKFEIAGALRSTTSTSSVKISGGAPDQLAKPFLHTCKTFMDNCAADNLARLAVEAALYYGTIARSYRSFCGSEIDAADKPSAEYVKTAKELLERALHLCNEPFQNVDALRWAVEDSIRLLGRDWYEPVTAEEIAAVKAAMVSGRGGIATHAGHWYNCRNGHPFAIGECGMPMQLARCPECGAPVGGQSHQAVEGVTRATSME